MLELFGLVAMGDNRDALVDESAAIVKQYWERSPRFISKAFLTQMGLHVPLGEEPLSSAKMSHGDVSAVRIRD